MCVNYNIKILFVCLIAVSLIAGIGSAGTSAASINGTSGDNFTSDVPGNPVLPAMSWASKASMPTSRSDLFRGKLVIDNKIYVAGGWTGSASNIVEVYDVDADNWSTAAPLPSPGINGAIQALNGKLYIMGGKSDDGGINVWEYDPVTDNYTTKASFMGDHSITSAVVNGKIYVISDKMNLYDPINDTWTSLSPHPSPRQYLTAEAVNGRIFTLGGNKYSKLLHEYDPANDSWAQKSSMPVVIETLNSVAIDGKIYAVGGDNNQSIWMYDPANDAWYGPLGDKLPTPRALAAISEVNGRIYVIGGCCPAVSSDANEEGTIGSISSVTSGREIENESLRLSGSTNITIWFKSSIKQSLAVEETIPSGWKLTRILDDADGFRNATNEWIWLNATSGKTMTLKYKLTPPDDAEIGSYYINGTITAQNGEVSTIGGNNTITLDIYSYYRKLGSSQNIVETADLLKAMNDWRYGFIPPGFIRPLSMWELTELANEWALT